jgi:hypothetical protein
MPLSYTPLELDHDRNIIKKTVTTEIGKNSQFDVILLSLIVLTLLIISSILYILLSR